MIGLFKKAVRSSRVLRSRVIFVGAGAVVLALTVGRDLTAQASGFYMQVFGDALPGSSEYKRRPKQQPQQPPKFQANTPKPYSVGRIGDPRMGGKRSSRKVHQSTIVEQGVTAGYIDENSSASSSLFSRLYRKGSGPTYRTMCVRQCDGYYFPVSFATGGENLETDAATCKASCGSPVALYYYPNPGADIGDMVSLDSGEAYDKLKNAYLYRKTFIADCRCRPEPWTKGEKERHAAYAAAHVDPYAELAKADRAEKKRRALARRKTGTFDDVSVNSRLRRYQPGQRSKYIRRADRRSKRYSARSDRRRHYMRGVYAVGRR